MNANTRSKMRSATAIGIAFWMLAAPLLIDVSGQRSRSTTRSTTSRTTRYGGTTAQRSTASRTTTTRTTTGSYYNRGAVAVGEEGYAAVGRRGAVVGNEEGAAAVGRHGNVVVAGEEGVAARGRYGNVVVGNNYESYEAWRVVAGTTRAIAIGTMLARPPTAATTTVVAGTTYWVYQNTYYARAYSNGAVVYQVVARPH